MWDKAKTDTILFHLNAEYKKQNKWANIENRNRPIDTENLWLSEGRGEEMGKVNKEDKVYKLIAIK